MRANEVNLRSGLLVGEGSEFDSLCLHRESFVHLQGTLMKALMSATWKFGLICGTTKTGQSLLLRVDKVAGMSQEASWWALLQTSMVSRREDAD